MSIERKEQNHSRSITGHTKLIGLLGSPVAHSISPKMHNLAFSLCNLDYTYLCFDVGLEKLSTAVEGLRALNIHGFNCTMPIKNKMFELVDECSTAAKLIGAVNTVKNEKGKLIGHNTDGIGYMESVRQEHVDVLGKTITIFGTGGAAISICVQAALDGVKTINLFTRDSKKQKERLKDLLYHLRIQTSCNIYIYSYEEDGTLRTCLKESSLLVQATNVGMAPNVDDCILKDSSYFHKNLVVSDIIYEPHETKLLQMASSFGCKTFNGLYMLLYQGAAAFEIWTGKKMPIKQISDILYKS